MTHAPTQPLKAAKAMKDLPWWKGAVIYQIYPRSFQDSNGDGIGDLKGCLERLDYVASLGVDGIWICPFYPSPQRDYGYDVADYCGVDPMFGTLADFDAIIAKAHALGLKVIIDQVYSHTSDQHAWFKESRSSRTNPKADWYVWADPKPDGAPPNNWQGVFGDPCWEWDNTRRQYYLHNFLKEQPDLNVHNPDVQDAVLDIARFWLDRGVDGFRLDAINFAMHDLELRDNPPLTDFERPPTRPFDYQDHIYNQSHPDIVGFIERLRALFNDYPGTFTVAEVGGAHAQEEMQLYTHGNKRFHSAYSFEYLYAPALTSQQIKLAEHHWPDTPEAGWPSWEYANHDAPRAISRWGGGHDQTAYTRMIFLLLMCLRGNPILYQGDELGLPQAHVPFEHLKDPEAIANWPETLGRDGARTPMPWSAAAPQGGFSCSAPWLPVDPAHLAYSVDLQEKDSGSMLHFLRQVLAFRKGCPALRWGNIRFLDAPESVAAFVRAHDGDEKLCVFNLSNRPTQWQPADADRWRVGIHSAAEQLSACPAVIAPSSGYVAVRA